MHFETLDSKLQQLALKHKDFVILDLHFPNSVVPGFVRQVDHRAWHIPNKHASVLQLAEGLALGGFTVLILGFDGNLEHVDRTLSIKILRENENGSWDNLETGILSFGPMELLIPLGDSSIVQTQ